MDALKPDQGTGRLDQLVHGGKGADDIICQVVHAQDLGRGQAAVRRAAQHAVLVFEFSFKGGEGTFAQVLPEMVDDPGRIGVKAGGEGNVYDIGTDAVSVFTKETDGKEELTQITVHDKTARTAKGVGVGSTEDEVRNAYGEPNDEVVEGAKLLTYEFEGYSILFAFNDNVAAISYFISK